MKRILKLITLALLLVFIIAPEWPDFGDEEYQLSELVGQHYFNFVTWETAAIGQKIEGVLARGHQSLSDEARKQIVLDYLSMMYKVGQLEWEIESVYVDPDVDDPLTETAVSRAELTDLRQEMASLQPLAEAILQDQVSAVLAEEGFAIANQTWPPVMMKMTPLPLVLIVSPREVVDRLYGYALEAGYPVADRELLETAVYDELDRSALVVPIGGMGSYPSMIKETANINWLMTVIAHEWVHHWLSLNPLGVVYLESPQLRTINETVASIVGDEVGAMVIEQFYPEFAPPPAPEEDVTADIDEEIATPEPPAFDFRAEMGITRVELDRLLAEGAIDEAEAYLEDRRRVFVENGYNIRKLNQAYFAFYGAYADAGGATGADPIGPMLLEMREASPSLRAFMDTVAPINSYEEMLDVYDEVMAE